MFLELYLMFIILLFNYKKPLVNIQYLKIYVLLKIINNLE